MTQFLSLLFVPQEKNNHHALLLQPGYLALLIGIYLLNLSFLKTLAITHPGVLGYSSEITVSKVFDQTNAQRLQNNLPALKYNSILSQSATLKAQDMFANNYWAHNSPQGKVPWDFFKQAGYDYSVAGENLAKDFYDTDNLTRAWMNSPTHRDNILSPKYQDIGIAVVNGVLNGEKTTLVIQHFGTPLNPSTSVSTDSPPLTATSDQGKVLSSITINPLTVSKILGLLMFTLIIGVLAIDGYVAFKNQHYRFTGSSVGHIGFLAVIFLILLFTQQGAIF